MTHWILLGGAGLLWATPAFTQHQVQAQKLISPIRQAGTYHVATGTWTHASSSSNLGPDVIYSSTAPSGYFGVGWEGAWGGDEGILPGPSNPLSGPQDCYQIDGFEFSYCTLSVSPSWQFFFLDSFIPCSPVLSPPQCSNALPSYTLPGMPGGSACWLVTVDLVGLETPLLADGGICAPGYQGGQLGLDHFGIAHSWTTPAGGTTGPVLAGYDPRWSAPGDGTCYNTAFSCAAGNTGLGAKDYFSLDGPLSPGCYFFGGYTNLNGCGGPATGAAGQFYMEMYTDCSVPCEPGCGLDRSVYCDSNPAQNGDISIDNCRLDGTGNVVTVSGSSSTLFAYLLVAQGSTTSTDPPGSRGDLCLTGGGPIGRYNADLQAPQGSGTYSTDIYNGNTGGGAGSLPDPPGSALQYGETWNFQGWNRMPAGTPTTWTRALRVTFL